MWQPELTRIFSFFFGHAFIVNKIGTGLNLFPLSVLQLAQMIASKNINYKIDETFNWGP
jgi:hypothetical protein